MTPRQASKARQRVRLDQVITPSATRVFLRADQPPPGGTARRDWAGFVIAIRVAATVSGVLLSSFTAGDAHSPRPSKGTTMTCDEAEEEEEEEEEKRKKERRV